MHTIERDDPGQRLAIRWRGLPPELGKKIFITLFLLPFLVVPLFAVAALVKDISGVLVFGLIGFFWYGAIALFLFFAGQIGAYWSRLEWDTARGWTAKHVGICLWGWKNYSVQPGRLRAIKFEIGAEGGGPLAINLHLRFDDDAKGRSVQIPLCVKDLNRRPEAMDLLFRIARIGGWQGYRVLRSDPRNLDIELLRKADPTTNAQSVPTMIERARYETDVAVARFQEPELTVALFKPEHLKVLWGVFPVTDWRPGDKVRLFIPAIPRSGIITGAVIGAIAGGVAGFLGSEIANFKVLARWCFGVLGAAIGGLGAGIGMRFAFPEREHVFDWAAGQATFRRAEKARVVPLTEIQGVLLRGQKAMHTERHDKHDHSYTAYWCELIVVLPGPDVTLVTTDESRDDPDPPYRLSLSMAVELARALNVPWRWEEYS